MRTVEGELGAAFQKLIGSSPKLTVAGRTDAGVHAWGQVASLTVDDRVDVASLAGSLNGVLAPDIAVVEAEAAGEGFDARRDARSRSYCYRVLARPSPSPLQQGRALWVRRPLEEDLLQRLAAMLPGSHDFTAFTPTETDHVSFERDVAMAEWRRSGELLEFWIEADSFIRHMVRTLVGTMLEVCAGRMTGEQFERLLRGAPRTHAGPTAEPYGLYLASVRY